MVHSAVSMIQSAHPRLSQVSCSTSASAPLHHGHHTPLPPSSSVSSQYRRRSLPGGRSCLPLRASVWPHACAPAPLSGCLRRSSPSSILGERVSRKAPIDERTTRDVLITKYLHSPRSQAFRSVAFALSELPVWSFKAVCEFIQTGSSSSLHQE